ncbi:MAG: DUF2807 domain-containing protein [Ferruginibacter sp.]
MKRTFFLLLAIAATMSSFAQPVKDPNNATKKVVMKNAITSVIINDNLSVVLLNDASKEILIEGSENVLDQFLVSESKNGITITNNSGKGRTAALVYIPAALIKKITINGASAISSYEMLNNKNIDVLVNGDCKLWLKTYGAVNVEATSDFDYTYTARVIAE